MTDETKKTEPKPTKTKLRGPQPIAFGPPVRLHLNSKQAADLKAAQATGIPKADILERVMAEAKSHVSGLETALDNIDVHQIALDMQRDALEATIKKLEALKGSK